MPCRPTNGARAAGATVGVLQRLSFGACMMNLVEVIKNQLSNGTITRLSALIGAGEDATRFATGAAVPAVLSALSNVASSKDGAQRLVSALGDFDRGPMSDVHSMLSRQPGAVLEEGNNLLT